MTHEMDIWHDSFVKIKEQTKTIEMRLFDEKPVSYTHLIVFCVNNIHIVSPSNQLIKIRNSEAFQSVHHVSFILCYTVLYDFVSLAFSLTRVHRCV